MKKISRMFFKKYGMTINVNDIINLIELDKEILHSYGLFGYGKSKKVAYK